MWTDFTGTTIGEWGATVFAFALVPAHLASYILPLHFIWSLLRRYVARDTFTFNGKEALRKNFWGTYLLLSGLILVALYRDDRFMLLQGTWEIACGMGIFLLGPSWWASRSAKKRMA
jgi:hypothetical protein